MSNKDKILRMYFEEHKKQKVIADIVGVKQSYVSQIIKKDERYLKEKENRHKISLNKKTKYNKNYYKTYNRPKKNDYSYEQLQAQLDKDLLVLSSPYGFISDYAFSKWNRSIYNYDKNSSDLMLKKNIIVSIDVPKRVRNIVDPSCIRTTI